MAITTTADLFIPEIVAETVQGFVAAGKTALISSGAAIIKMGMPDGRGKVGDSIKIPYFNSIGEFEDVASDGDPVAAIAKLTQSNESAIVRHARKVAEITERAAANSDDPVGEISRQLAEGAIRRLDRALLDAAGNATGLASYTFDGTAATIGYDAVINARQLLGDESEEWAAMVVHSKVYADMLKLKDGQSRPLLLENAFSNNSATFLGMNIIVSDRATVVAGSPDIYESLLCKKGSLVAWVSDLSDKDVRLDTDITVPSDVLAMHLYFATHRYSRLAGKTKPGVVKLRSR